MSLIISLSKNPGHRACDIKITALALLILSAGYGLAFSRALYASLEERMYLRPK